MSEITRTIKVFLRKGFTINRGDVRNLKSARCDIGVEIEVPFSNFDIEHKRWNDYVDKVLAEEMTKQLAKVNYYSQTEQNSKVPEDAPASESTPRQDNGSATSMTGDPYAALPWHKAPRDPRLAMIRVTPQLSILGEELREKLKAAKNERLRSSNATYKLWLTEDGAEFLQRWSKSSEETSKHGQESPTE
jgi:hypothetical protein